MEHSVRFHNLSLPSHSQKYTSQYFRNALEYCKDSALAALPYYYCFGFVKFRLALIANYRSFVVWRLAVDSVQTHCIQSAPVRFIDLFLSSTDFVSLQKMFDSDCDSVSAYELFTVTVRMLSRVILFLILVASSIWTQSLSVVQKTPLKQECASNK